MDRRKVTIDCGMGVKKGYKIEVHSPLFEHFTTTADELPTLKVLCQNANGSFYEVDFVKVACVSPEMAFICPDEDCEDKHLFLEVTYYIKVEEIKHNKQLESSDYGYDWLWDSPPIGGLH